jgi:DNA-binding MarR family transcriptional regulator
MDEVDAIVSQWNRERPELRTDAMGTFGRLYRVARGVGEAIDRLYRSYGISRGEFDVLATLRRSGEESLTPTALASTMMLSTGGMTGRLDRLEAAGLVTRSPDPDDRRGLRISLTERGRALVDESIVAGVELQENVLAALDPKQRKAFDAALRALLAAVPKS